MMDKAQSSGIKQWNNGLL